MTFNFNTSFVFVLRGEGHLCPGSPITIHFHVHRGTVALPVTRLTDAVGYVTSPRYDGLHSVYLKNYDGYFHLQVSNNESVLIKFAHLVLDLPSMDYLELSVLGSKIYMRADGGRSIPPRVYRGSIQIYFHTDRKGELTGFKMMYAIFPRSQEPQPQELSLIHI